MRPYMMDSQEDLKLRDAAVRRRRAAYAKQTPVGIPGDPHSAAASEAGGVCMGFRFKALPPPENGGCGVPTHLAGTNGGTFPCGSMVDMFGDCRPRYCPRCQDAKGLDQFDKPKKETTNGVLRVQAPQGDPSVS